MIPALLALLLSSASPVQERQARALVKRSLKEYNLTQFDAALADIKRAYMLDPRPELLFNLGQCERALHHWELAKFAFERYLREKPAAGNGTLVERILAEVEKQRLAEVAASRPSAPAAAPAPQPILVEAPPAVATPAPAAAVEAAPAPEATKARTHALAWTLGSVGLAAGLVAGFGAYEVGNYDSQASSANAHAGTVSAGTLTPLQQNAQLWQPLSIALAVVAVAGLTAAGLTW
jgi:tetratricopeptide (TPR) repeat protein